VPVARPTPEAAFLGAGKRLVAYAAAKRRLHTGAGSGTGTSAGTISMISIGSPTFALRGMCGSFQNVIQLMNSRVG
jgi:hypothetical protein